MNCVREPCILKIAMEHWHGGLMVPASLMALACDAPPGPAREPSAQPGRWVSVNSDILAKIVQGDTHPRPTTEAGGATDNARLSSANLLSARARTPMAGACVRARHSGLLPVLTLVTLNSISVGLSIFADRCFGGQRRAARREQRAAGAPSTD
jgi:hypothetical protein